MAKICAKNVRQSFLVDNFVSETKLNRENFDDRCYYSVMNNNRNNEAFWIEVEVENVELKFQIDSGASISAIFDETYKEKFSKLKLKPCNEYFYFYHGSKIKLVGILEVKVKYKNLQRKLELNV